MSGPYNADCPWCNDDVYNASPVDADIPCFCKTSCGNNVCGFETNVDDLGMDDDEIAAWKTIAQSHGEIIEMSKDKSTVASSGQCIWCHTNKPATKEECQCEVFCGKQGCQKPNPNSKVPYNGGTQSWGNNGTTYSYMCDKDSHPKVLFKWHGIDFSGQRKSEVEKLTHDPNVKRLIINASNSSMHKPQPSAATKLIDECPNNSLKILESKDFIYVPPIMTYDDDLSLNWADGKAFPATFEWWKRLLEIVEAEDYDEVVVCCVGGHGRTGTSLAILLMLTHELEGKGGPSIVAEEWIKANYCKKAIETADQQYYLDYIAAMMENDDGPKSGPVAVSLNKITQ